MNTTNDLVAEERPEYKIKKNGGLSSLTSVELLTMLFGRSSTLNLQKARNILNLTEGSIKGLSKLTIKQIREVTNLTEQKANVLLAALELGRRSQIEETKKHEVLDRADYIYNYVKPYIDSLSHEELWVILMNHSFKPIKLKKISSGGLTETSFDVRIILKEALLNDSTVIAVAHNHPSGNLIPSAEDDRVTYKLKQACNTMRIYLLDHIIVTDSGYYSYSEEGKM